MRLEVERWEAGEEGSLEVEVAEVEVQEKRAEP